jgi:MoaA/NifB/PqqE/SkfB family radical SAM enzyme
MNTAQSRLNPQAKLAAHGKFSAFISGDRVFPINFEVSICHVCQAKCGWCFYSGTHMKLTPDSILDTDVGIHLIDDIASLGAKAVTWTGGGEPTIHPNFSDFSKAATTVGLKQGMFTNALASPKYNPAIFDWIRVSNTDRPWPVENMKILRSSAPVLGMALNYVGDDQSVLDALAVGEQVGADYVQVRQALALRGKVVERDPPNIQHPLLHITTYKFDDSDNPHGYTRCYGYNFAPFVWHNGDVDVCGYHRGSVKYTLGNLHKSSIKEIMDSAPRSVPVCGTCQVCCKNHEINKLINSSLELEDPHFV